MKQFGRELTPLPMSAFFDKCPFDCDGIASCKDWENIRARRTEYFMLCDKCGALGPSFDTQAKAHEVWGAVVRKCAVRSERETPVFEVEIT